MPYMTPYTGKEYRSWIVAVALCAAGFAGLGGMHRFYTGKTMTGLLWFMTGGLFGIGTILDFISILTGNFRTKSGEPLYRGEKWYE